MTFHQFAYRNVIRNFRIYAAFFMASFFSVFVFFIYSMLMFHPKIEDGFLGNVSMLGMGIAEIILVLFSWFFIFYSLKAFLEVRSREFGILLHLGMERRQLGKLVFLETLIIGLISIILGILFGYAFARFFFMIVRELLFLEELPLYLSWKPFVLTIAVYLSAFIVISLISVFSTPKRSIIDYIKNYKKYNVKPNYSKKYAILGIVLVIAGYILAFFSSKYLKISLIMMIPIFVTIGTYFIFTHSTLYIVDVIKGKKHLYWKSSRMLSIAEQSTIMKNEGKMLFVVTMVTTLAFICVGILAALSSYTSQYDKLNPLGLIYKGDMNNPYEKEHISSLVKELEDKGLSYHLTRFKVLKQTSSYTKYEVEVFRESDINHLLYSYGYPMVSLDSGQAMFIPYSEESINELSQKTVHTVLMENKIPLTIDKVYPKVIFPSSIISLNSIIISDEDFVKIKNPYSGSSSIESGYHLFTFDIPQWIETTDIGLNIQSMVAKERLQEHYNLPFYFENAGLNYSLLLSTYSLFTLVGLLVAVVFLLAAGSFVYFKLHSNLEYEKKKFDVLKRMGLTESELKKLVTKYLFPQFFLPWGVAMLHSAFAFIALQNILKNYVNISIVKEVVLAFAALIVIQVIYFFLIRWRYIAHVNDM